MSYYIIPATALLLLLLKQRRKGDAPDVAVKRDPSLGLQRVLDEFGPDIARKVERVYRLETANFTSEGYRHTGAAGQKAFALTFPFGWPARGTSPEQYLPAWWAVDTLEGGQPVAWVAWVDVSDAMRYLARFLADHGGNVGRWNSTEPDKQAIYRARVDAMPTPIVDALMGVSALPVDNGRTADVYIDAAKV